MAITRKQKSNNIHIISHNPGTSTTKKNTLDKKLCKLLLNKEVDQQK